jgi:phenylacetate-CoA ligase
MYNFIVRHAMAPVLDIFRGTRTMKCLTELEHSQWWPREKIIELQNQRLRQLVEYAYHNVPYYQHIFDERGLKPNDVETSNDLVKLPILTKKIIRANSDDIKAGNFPEKERVRLHTGGSTGEPLAFYSTRYDHITLGFAARQRTYSSLGLKMGDKYADLSFQYPYRSVFERLSQTTVDFLSRKLHIGSQKIFTTEMPYWYRKIKDFQPIFMTGYPSAIYHLANFIQSERKPGIKLKAVITGAEQLYDFQRKCISEAFSCDTYDYYGSNEEHLIAFECHLHSGYHIAAENVIVEVIDEDGKPADEKRNGRIVITNLHNYAMPFIRYDIGDLGMRADIICDCGRGLPLLTSLQGRHCDLIRTVSKGLVPGINLPWEFLTGWGIDQFQIVQEAIDKVVLKVVPRDTHAQQHISELNLEVIRRYRPILGDEMRITVKSVEQIPRLMSGKLRVVVSAIADNE